MHQSNQVTNKHSALVLNHSHLIDQLKQKMADGLPSKFIPRMDKIICKNIIG